MPDYKKIQEMVSHRVTFEYDTGAKIVGYLASYAPSEGPVQFAVLSKVQVLDATNNVIARFEELPIVPNNLVGFRVTEGPL
jgi:recombinational DNA repair protein RecT